MFKPQVLFFLIIELLSSLSMFSQDKLLTGFWVYSGNSNGLKVYFKSDSLITDKSGFEFKSNFKLFKRENKSFCANPPIEYKNYEGKWALKYKSILKLRYEFWGGEMKCKWRIKELTDSKLVFEEIRCKRIYNKKS